MFRMKSLTKALVTRDIFTHDIKIKNLLRFLTLLSKRFLFVNQGNLLTKCSPRYVRFLKSLRVSRWNLCLKIINIYSSQYCDQKCLGVTWAIVCSTCFRRMSVRPKLLPSRFITIFYSPAKFIFGQNSWNEWSDSNLGLRASGKVPEKVLEQNDWNYKVEDDNNDYPQQP